MIVIFLFNFALLVGPTFFCLVNSASNENVTSNATVIKVENCSLLYAHTVMLSQSINGKQVFRVTLPPLTKAGDGSSCGQNSNSSILVADWKSGLPSPVTSFKLTMVFNSMTATRNWRLTSAQAILTCANVGNCSHVDAALTSLGDVTAPKNYSYHCINVSMVHANLTVSFVKLQVQPFNLRNGTSFSDATDCIGFFSIGVLSALFITLILLGILTFGIVMLADISTMDRFDDPKSKGLQVHAPVSD